LGRFLLLPPRVSPRLHPRRQPFDVESGRKPRAERRRLAAWAGRRQDDAVLVRAPEAALVVGAALERQRGGLARARVDAEVHAEDVAWWWVVGPVAVAVAVDAPGRERALAERVGVCAGDAERGKLDAHRRAEVEVTMVAQVGDQLLSRVALDAAKRAEACDEDEGGGRGRGRGGVRHRFPRFRKRGVSEGHERVRSTKDESGLTRAPATTCFELRARAGKRHLFAARRALFLGDLGKHIETALSTRPAKKPCAMALRARATRPRASSRPQRACSVTIRAAAAASGAPGGGERSISASTTTAPARDADVAAFAAASFAALARLPAAGPELPLAKMALWISLEEEANDLMEEEERRRLSRVRGGGGASLPPPPPPLPPAQTPVEGAQTAASRATWSLERLDALAVEVRAAFLVAMDLQVPPVDQERSGGRAAAAAWRQHHHQQQQHWRWRGGGQQHQQQQQQHASPRPQLPPLLPPLPPALKRLVARVASLPLPLPLPPLPHLLPRPVPKDHLHPPLHAAAAAAAQAPWSFSASASAATTPAPPPPLTPALSDANTTAAMRRFPARALEAVSEVLFQRHGYKACGRYGHARDALLSAVLERGEGTCSVLTLVYSEVSRRAGLPVCVRPLNEASERAAARAAEVAARGGDGDEDGLASASPSASSSSSSTAPLAAGVGATPPYAVLWPDLAVAAPPAGLLASPPSSSSSSSSPSPSSLSPLRLPGGAALVIDAYGGGALLAAAEVCELFGVEGGEAALFGGAAGGGGGGGASSPADPTEAAAAAAATTTTTPTSAAPAPADSAQKHAWGRLLIAATLAELRDAHWSHACGRGPAPRDLPPLSAATALRAPPTRLDHAAAERAASAALKRLLVLSPLAAELHREAAAAAEAAAGLGGGVAAARTATALAASAAAAAAAARATCELTAARLDLAVLRYFTGRYEDAWLELGAYAEAVRAGGERDDDAELLLEKLRLEITAR
jgi:hypothetical protein